MVDSFNKLEEDATEFRYVLSACNHSFISQFKSSYVEFSRRQTNEVARALRVDMF